MVFVNRAPKATNGQRNCDICTEQGKSFLLKYLFSVENVGE